MIYFSFFKGLLNKIKTEILTNRKLSDIICENTEIESLPINIFDLNSSQIECKDRAGLR